MDNNSACGSKAILKFQTFEAEHFPDPREKKSLLIRFKSRVATTNIVALDNLSSNLRIIILHF